jgi:hypothetical protein
LHIYYKLARDLTETSWELLELDEQTTKNVVDLIKELRTRTSNYHKKMSLDKQAFSRAEFRREGMGGKRLPYDQAHTQKSHLILSE